MALAGADPAPDTLTLVHLRRTGIGRHVHHRCDRRVAQPRRQRIAAVAGGPGATPPRARHRRQGQAGRRSVRHGRCAVGGARPSLIRDRYRICGVGLALREVATVRLGNAQHRWVGTGKDGGGIRGARRYRSSARDTHLVHLRRTGIGSHVHHRRDRRIACPRSQRVAAVARGPGATPPRARHRHQRQARRRSLRHRRRAAGSCRPGLIRYGYRICRVGLALREVAAVRLGDA